MNVSEDLKIHLLAEGLRVSAEAEVAMTDGGRRVASLREYVTTSGVILRLPGDVYVNAPTIEEFCKSSPYLLSQVDGRLVIVGPAVEVPAEAVPVPAFCFALNRDGIPLREFAVSHTDRVRVSPIAGCAFRCTFCDLPFTHAYQTKRVEQLVEAVTAALEDPVLPARHVLVSGGTPKLTDREYLERSIRAICASTRAPVDVMMVPWRDPDLVPRLRSFGVDGAFFNLEVFGPTAVRRFTPQKASLGSGGILRALERAADVFGRRKARSLLLVGLEPVEDTLRGVEAIAAAGAVPVLSPFRPSPDTPLRSVPPPNYAMLRDVYEGALSIARRHGLPLGPECVPCQHNTLTFPSSVN